MKFKEFSSNFHKPCYVNNVIEKVKGLFTSDPETSLPQNNIEIPKKAL